MFGLWQMRHSEAGALQPILCLQDNDILSH